MRKLGPIGATTIKFGEAKATNIHLVDSGGCEPGSNKGAKIEHVNVYYSDDIKNLTCKDGAVHVKVHGNYLPENHHSNKERNGKFRHEIDYPDLLEIKLSSTVKTLDIFGVGNVGVLKVPKNVEKIHISYSDVAAIVFEAGCDIKELSLNEVEVNTIKTGRKIGKWPSIKTYGAYKCKFYSKNDIPKSKCTVTGNFYAGNNPEMFVFKSNLGEHYGEGVELYKDGEHYYGFGRKFQSGHLVTFCSTTGMLDVLEHFNLKPLYPIKNRPSEHWSSDKKLPSYLCKSYDGNHKETTFHSIKCFEGIPVIQNERSINLRRASMGGPDGCTVYPYLDPKTNKFNYAPGYRVEYESLTRERYDYILKSLELYFGKDYLKFIKDGDLKTGKSAGLFSGLFLTETDYEFKKVTKTTIDELDWSKLPDDCNVLTMFESGTWWGNEHDYGLRAEGGHWKTYGGTGMRWVNICSSTGIEIAPVSDWKKKYLRPKKYKVTPKPFVSPGPEVCMFSGSAAMEYGTGRMLGDPEKPTGRYCTRTSDGHRGDCSTCRVAAEWEEAYG